MPILGQLSALIGGGALFIGDNESQADEDFGEAGPHPVLDVGTSQVIVRVQNGAADGVTAVRVASRVIDDPVGPIVFDGKLHISSGVLRAGDGLDLAVLRFGVPIGDLPVRVYVDVDHPDFYSPEFVDIVLPKLDGSS